MLAREEGMHVVPGYCETPVAKTRVRSHDEDRWGPAELCRVPRHSPRQPASIRAASDMRPRDDQTAFIVSAWAREGSASRASSAKAGRGCAAASKMMDESGPCWHERWRGVRPALPSQPGRWLQERGWDEH